MKSIKVQELAQMIHGRILCHDEELFINDISTNSKYGTEHTLFLPILGERVDAHDYIKDAYEHGMRATLTMREQPEDHTDGMVYIQVTDTVMALQSLAAWYRSQFDIPLIGITGSVGKTTTKEMVAAALSVKYHVLKTIGNMNSQIGLPQMILKLSDEDEFAVIEQGMSQKGEMSRLSSIAKPQYAVITNIGVSHIGNLGSKENIREEKMNIINEFKKGSKLFLNGEDLLLREVAEYAEKNLCQDTKTTNNLGSISLSNQTQDALRNCEVVLFGLSDCFPYYAKDIKVLDNEMVFTYCYPEKGDIYQERIRLSVLGMHNVLNAVVALTIALHFGILPVQAKKGLYAYQPVAMRGVIERIGEITLLDDTYNASPDSMKSAVDVLLALPNLQRRILVFGDILELGTESNRLHYEVGTHLAQKKVDILITVGKAAAFIAKGLNDAQNQLENQTEIYSFLNNQDAANCLISLVTACDGVCFKGSRGMKLEEIVAEMKKSITE